MLENLIKKLWPLLQPRVIALLAGQLKKIGAPGTLSDEAAVQIATAIVALVADLLQRDDAVEPELVALATQQLEARG